MDYPRKNGMTRRASQEQVRKTLGQKPSNWIDDPVIWSCGEHLWSAFWELDAARSGLEPISYTEISAYKAAVGIELNAHDIRAIKAMDNARTRLSAKIEGEK